MAADRKARTDNEVPEKLRPLYDRLADAQEVRAARADHYRGAGATTAGAEAAAHTARLELAERRYDTEAKIEAMSAQIERDSTCPACGGRKPYWIRVTAFCDACTAADQWLAAQAYAAEVINGITRSDRIAAYREEHPR